MTPQQKSLNVSLDKEFAVNFMSPEFPNFISRSISPIEIKGADLLDFSNKNFNQIPKNLEDNGPKVLSLSDNKIDRIMNIPSTLLKLSLKSNVISRIENLDKSSKIRILDLSNNKITMIENLNHCKNLQELDLANNLIKIIENLDTLKELKRLGLEKNSISKLSSIRALSFNVNLNFLVLKENPIAAEKNYKPSVISLLPKLVVLDYKKLAGTQGTFRKIFNRDNQFFSAPIFKIDVTPEPTLMISHSKKSLFLSNTLVIPNPTSPPKTAETQTMTNLNKVKIDIEIQACPETIKKDMVRKPVLKSLIKLVPSRFKPNSSHELAKIRRFFKNVYIFKDIPSTFIETLINASIFYIVDEGEIVKYAEAITEQMIVIYRGKMQYLNRVLGSGANLFAESLVDPEEIEGDVVCIERCEFFVLCKQDLDNIIKNYPNYREAYMKNYLDKNVNPADINIRSQTFFKNPKKDPIGIKSQAKPVHSLNLKSLITSETSYQLGLIPHFKSTLSPLTSKIKYEVDSLYKDADPFDLEFPNHAKPGASKIEAVTAKVTRMFEIYKKERDQEAVSANIINEAKSFVKFGAKSDIELLALKRESLRKCIESCEEDGNEEFVNEYINMLI